MRTKLIAQLEYGLTVDPDQVLYVMIHHVSDQKGFQILLDASRRDVSRPGRTGDPRADRSRPNDQRAEQLAAGMRALMEYYPGSVATRIGYQEISLPLARRRRLPDAVGVRAGRHLATGGDELRLPVVVAHATGGLRDTVAPLQLRGSTVSGCGVLFGDYRPDAFLDAMARCTWFFRHATAAQIRRARNNARRSIVYWDSAAQRYLEELHALQETIPAAALPP